MALTRTPTRALSLLALVLLGCGTPGSRPRHMSAERHELVASAHERSEREASIGSTPSLFAVAVFRVVHWRRRMQIAVGAEPIGSKIMPAQKSVEALTLDARVCGGSTDVAVKADQ